jgi:3-dehydroquinate synthase
MGALPVSDRLVIQSHTGAYIAHFDEDAPWRIAAGAGDRFHVIADRRVAALHEKLLAPLLSCPSVLLLDATEINKSLERMPAYVEHLLQCGIRRNQRLVAVGGGIIQDITCFLAATLLRGVDWLFLPTTLLAQCDSCIGSKSSINCGDTKNIVGTFTPPREVWIASRFLETLDERDLRSGVGEMLKIHAIEGPWSFDRLAADYDRLFHDRRVMIEYIRSALAIKKPFVEIDEFDRRERNVLNFGHSFGHAIEAATDFAVPHGIGVTMGMDVALEVARGLGRIGDDVVDRMRPILRHNARGFLDIAVPRDRFLEALVRDKKNVGSGTVTVILPEADCRMSRSVQPLDKTFLGIVERYFAEVVAA